MVPVKGTLTSGPGSMFDVVEALGRNVSITFEALLSEMSMSDPASDLVDRPDSEKGSGTLLLVLARMVSKLSGAASIATR